MSVTDKDQYSDKETAKRMEDALRRALSTPHKPNRAFVGKTANAESGDSSKRKNSKKKTTK